MMASALLSTACFLPSNKGGLNGLGVNLRSSFGGIKLYDEVVMRRNNISGIRKERVLVASVVYDAFPPTHRPLPFYPTTLISCFEYN
uniref:Uncharacterized protein n=1 Tax=Rhizophora mucronata TaxID=61149 RepID=A0A2P2KZB6_RHIMU